MVKHKNLNKATKVRHCDTKIACSEYARAQKNKDLHCENVGRESLLCAVNENLQVMI